ncbi:MAG TPA: Maf family protein [Candidatus Angelobacter sp.]|nr:Maf family protein [Candidatus Angelobacter sp.]
MLLENLPVLILASGSPRRQELLREAGIAFEVHAANINEEQIAGETPIEYASRLSREKAQAVAAVYPQRYVLGADTIVVVGDEVSGKPKILGKPKDAVDAAGMLRMLSGRGHEVTTAVTLVMPNGHTETRAFITKTCTTQVQFRKLTEDEIQQYVAGGEPMDKAGAYAIQGGAAQWLERMQGEHSNVVGLPLSVVTEMLRSRGFMQ